MIIAITVTIDIIKCVAIVISRGMTIAIVVVAIFDGVAAAIVVAVGIVMGVVIGATALWIIVAPICLPKTEESSTAGESGMYVYSFFAGGADHLWLKRQNPSFLGFDIDVAACKRLVKRTFTSHELLSFVETVFPNKDERDIVHSLHRDDAQAFIDVTDEALDKLDPPPQIRKKCLKSLHKICGRHAILPKSLHIPPCYDRQGIPLYQGGFADVWKGEHQGREVAVKVLRVYKTSDLEKVTGVGHCWFGLPVA